MINQKEDKIRNGLICGNLQVAPIVKKIIVSLLGGSRIKIPETIHT